MVISSDRPNSTLCIVTMVLTFLGALEVDNGICSRSFRLLCTKLGATDQTVFYFLVLIQSCISVYENSK